MWLICIVYSFSSEEEEEAASEEEGEDPTLDSLSQAIAFQVSLHLVKWRIQNEWYLFNLGFLSLQQARMEEEEKQKLQDAFPSTSSDSRKPRIKKSAYFSDEEELSDWSHHFQLTNINVTQTP